MLICFFGVDGSGKTSHSKSLLEYFKSKKISAKYVRVANRPIITYPFLLLTKLLGFWRVSRNDAWTDPLELADGNIKQKLGYLFRCCLLIDNLIIQFYKIHVPLLYNQVIICDRYVYDLIMELHLSGLSNNTFFQCLIKLSPIPTMGFFFQAPNSIIVQRRPSFELEKIKQKQQIYEKICEHFNFYKIYTSDEFEYNQEIIRTQVDKLVNKK